MDTSYKNAGAPRISQQYTQQSKSLNIKGYCFIALGIITLIGSLAAAGLLYSKLGYASLAIPGAGFIFTLLTLISAKYCGTKVTRKVVPPRAKPPFHPPTQSKKKVEPRSREKSSEESLRSSSPLNNSERSPSPQPKQVSLRSPVLEESKSSGAIDHPANPPQPQAGIQSDFRQDLKKEKPAAPPPYTDSKDEEPKEPTLSHIEPKSFHPSQTGKSSTLNSSPPAKIPERSPSPQPKQVSLRSPVLEESKSSGAIDHPANPPQPQTAIQSGSRQGPENALPVHELAAEAKSIFDFKKGTPDQLYDHASSLDPSMWQDISLSLFTQLDFTKVWANVDDEQKRKDIVESIFYPNPQKNEFYNVGWINICTPDTIYPLAPYIPLPVWQKIDLGRFKSLDFTKVWANVNDEQKRNG